MNCQLYLGDISFTNGLSTSNSKLLAHLFDIQPEAVKFIHFIYEWMQSQRLYGVKRYTCVLLVLFFLQNENLMPPIKTVQQTLDKKICGGKKSAIM
jgi:hypothetical protein